MPNWCHNKLKVTGPVSDLLDFAKRVRTEPVEIPNPEYRWARNALDRAEDEQREALAVRLAETPETIVVASQPLSFAETVPEPAEHEGETGGLFPGWYDWRIRHWGTKWDANFDAGPMIAFGAETMDVEASVAERGIDVQTSNELEYKFDTAWSPPMPWLLVTAPQFPELEFTLRFGEVGNGYASEVVAKGWHYTETELEVEDVLGPEEMWF